MMRQTTPCSAWVIHVRAYRDTDFLVDILTRDHGRFRGVLRGARSAKRRNTGSVQPGQSISASWSGRNSLKTIKVLGSAGKHRHYTAKALWSVLYVNELLYRLLPDADPYPHLFQAYGQCLDALCEQAATNHAFILRTFEFYLLRELGYGIDFNCEHDGQTPLRNDCTYCFDPAQGFMRLTNQHARDNPANNAFSGEVLARLSCLSHDDRECLRVARAITRVAIQSVLGDRHLGAHDMLKYGI